VGEDREGLLVVCELDHGWGSFGVSGLGGAVVEALR